MFSGTMLVTNIDKEEINRGILDLLKKINELSLKIDKLTKIIKELEDAAQDQ